MIAKQYKIPVSILVIIYTKDMEILLLHRKDKKNFWQSVTGSIEEGESPVNAAKRELLEETGIDLNNMKSSLIGVIGMSPMSPIILNMFLVWNYLKK